MLASSLSNWACMIEEFKRTSARITVKSLDNIQHVNHAPAVTPASDCLPVLNTVLLVFY